MLLGLVVGCADAPPADVTGAQTSSSSTGTTAAEASSVGPDPTSSTSAGSTHGIEESSSTAASADDSTGTPACAPAPSPSPPWLSAYLDDTVGLLTGQTALPSGVTLTERATQASRSATADWLEAEFDALGLVAERHAYSTTGTNIAGLLPATEPGGRTFVVGAHFDTVPNSPGANDNATGIAFVLSLARYLSSIECRSHDVIFVGFDEEEIGLIGSDAFAQLLVQQRTDVVAVHTIDQMGWDQDGDRAIELERADEGLFEVYDAANALLDSPITLTPTGTGFTDHVSFRPYGFAAIGLTEEFVSGDTTPHYHLSSDTYDTVNFEYLASTCVLANQAWSLLIDAS